MKQKPWAEDFSKGVAKAYKQGCDDTLKQYGSTLTQLYKLGSQIMRLTAGYQPSKAVQTDPNDYDEASAPAPKHGPVKALPAHVDAAYDVLCRTKPLYSALSPKNVAAMWQFETGAYRLAGAALKALVAQGKATVKRGKYAQVEPLAQTTDGATSEAP